MTKGLLSWDAMSALLASSAVGCVGYVGFTVAQVVSVATTGDPAVAAVAVADPPAQPPPPAIRASAAASAGAEDGAGVAPLADRATPAQPADPTESTDPTDPTDPTAGEPGVTGRSARPSRESEPAGTRRAPLARTMAKPAAEPSSRQARRQEAALRHALWADRQLAAMLRATPVTSLWFGGAAWTTPVAAYHLTARFGETSSLWASTHTGLDFAAPTGTPVRAATAGTVTFVGWAGAYGNKIEITHPDGSETWYAHLSRTDVRVGTPVGTGAVIGAVGATGNVTGPHLHFEVRPGGDSPVDPEAALEQHGVHP